MKQNAKVGDTGQVDFCVAARHAIDFADGDMPAILSTPWLIWYLEHAAREAVLPKLESHESTVGVQVDVEHLAATPLGQQVTCRARVIHVEGTLVRFQLEAHDEQELIARGLHKLRVIESARLRRRVERKLRS